MKNVVLTMIEREAVYGSRLAGYIGGHAGSPFQVKLFLEHPVRDQEAAACDLALVTSSLWKTYEGVFARRPVLVLDEDGAAGEGAAYLAYKYQSAEVLYQKLLEICIENGSKRIRPAGSRQKDFRMILTYLPLPSEESSRKMREWMLRESGRHKILYVNLEQIPSPPVSLRGSREGEKCFSDIIYYLKQSSANLGARICAAASGKEMDMILPPELISDAVHLTREDWLSLAGAVREETDYDHLILDFGCSLPPAAAVLCCDEILVFSTGSKWEKELSSRYRMILERVGRTGLDEILHILII